MSLDVCEAPPSLLVCERSGLREQKNRLRAQVQELHFNHKVSLLLPGCGSAPSHLDSVINTFSPFYLVRNLPIYGLLDKNFLETAVYQGSVYGLSYRTRVDEDNCVALMPNGRLCLSLDKHSYQRLGLEGKPSRFSAKDRYIVLVDLTDSRMAPGGRGYHRLLTGLTSRLPLTMDFLFSHHPGGESCLKPLLSGYDWSEHRPAVSSRILTQLTCPSDPRSCDPHALLEWMGAVDADVSASGSCSFLSSFQSPEPGTTLSRSLSVSVSGFLLPQDVLRLLQEVRRYLEQPQPAASWAAMTVHGFTDSPVSWRENEHGVLRGGENFYSLLMFTDHSHRLLLAAGAHDTCPP